MCLWRGLAGAECVCGGGFLVMGECVCGGACWYWVSVCVEGLASDG